MWDIIAIYRAGLKLGKQRGHSDREAEHYAVDLLKRTQRNVKVMDKSGRESVTTFERGVGDMIVTYENELAPHIKQGRPYMNSSFPMSRCSWRTRSRSSIGMLTAIVCGISRKHSSPSSMTKRRSGPLPNSPFARLIHQVPLPPLLCSRDRPSCSRSPSWEDGTRSLPHCSARREAGHAPSKNSHAVSSRATSVSVMAARI